jgi:PmbA protein
VFGRGQISLDDMISETKQGLFVTNNWYTRYQNYRTGEYSTVPRDAAFKIEAGELKEPVAGFRISDSIPRQLSNIELISKERTWIKWWEVETPTLAPAMMISDVKITRAVGS